MASFRRAIRERSYDDVITHDSDELMLLLKDCEGKDFVSRRDTAILLLLMDTGIRRGECSGIDLADLNMRTQRVRIEGKGDRERWVPFGISTAVPSSSCIGVPVPPCSSALASIGATARAYVEMYRKYSDDFPREARDT